MRKLRGWLGQNKGGKMAAKSGNMTPKYPLNVVFGDEYEKIGFRPKSYRNFSVKIADSRWPRGLKRDYFF